MWRYFRCGNILDSISGEILDVKKCEMYRVKDNMIHTVLPLHGLYLCCFVAKSVQFQFTLYCPETYFVAIFASSMRRKIKPKILSVEKKRQI